MSEIAKLLTLSGLPGTSWYCTFCTSTFTHFIYRAAAIPFHVYQWVSLAPEGQVPNVYTLTT